MKLRDVLTTTRGRFFLTAMGAVIPLMVVFWFAAGDLQDLLRPSAEWLAVHLQLADSITATPAHDWVVVTGLERASGVEVGPVVTTIASDDLRRLLFGFPLFFALLLAPPRHRPWRAALIGAVTLALVFDFSTCAHLFNTVSVIVNHRPSLAMDTVPPPSFTVTRPPFSGAVFFLAGLGLYLVMQVIPLALPVVLWALFNQQGLKDLAADQGTSAHMPA